MSEGAFAVLVLSVLVLVFATLVGVVVSGAITPPCDGGHTGPQTYKGDRIECYHGDVIEVYP